MIRRIRLWWALRQAKVLLKDFNRLLESLRRAGL